VFPDRDAPAPKYIRGGVISTEIVTQIWHVLCEMQARNNHCNNYAVNYKYKDSAGDLPQPHSIHYDRKSEYLR